MSQSRRGSFIEAVINVMIGMGISMTANTFIFPLFGWHISAVDNLKISVIYTVISIVRSYCVRRWFNGMIQRAAARIDGDAS